METTQKTLLIIYKRVAQARALHHFCQAEAGGALNLFLNFEQK